VELRTASFRMAQNLPGLCAEIFALIIGLRRAIEFDNPDLLKRKISQTFDTMFREGERLGISRSDLEESKYILTAFLDETILVSRWPHKAQWRESPLQLEYFGTHVAGEEVFNKLKAARANASEKADLLEVYYTCLALGFKGIMVAYPDGEQRLKTLIHEVWQDLQRVRPGAVPALSPVGLPRDKAAPVKGSDLNLWLLAGVMAVSIVVLIFGLDVVLGMNAQSVRSALLNLVP